MHSQDFAKRALHLSSSYDMMPMTVSMKANERKSSAIWSTYEGRNLTPSTIPWPCTTAHGQGRLALRGRNRGCVDVQLVQGAVRDVPRTVRVVGPCRVGGPAEERQPRTAAVVDVVTTCVRVRRAR